MYKLVLSFWDERTSFTKEYFDKLEKVEQMRKEERDRLMNGKWNLPEKRELGRFNCAGKYIPGKNEFGEDKN